MKFIKKHLSTIVISSIIGVLIFYIQPILNYVGDEVVDFFIFASDSFSAFYYKSLATNNPYVFDDLNSYILILVSISLLFSLINIILERKNKLKRKVANSLDNIRSLKEELNNEKKKIDKNSIQEDIDKLESSAEELSLSIDKKDNKFLIFIILISSISILLFSTYVLNKSITRENITFRNKMIILLPDIGEENTNLLKSEWAQMKNSNDYESLMVKIEVFEQKGKQIDRSLK